MDKKLLDAAHSGDINTLHQLLRENPFILTDHTLLNPKQNPLTVAIKANQQLFVREILRVKPELALELDRDGFRPLDVASAYGKLEIVGELLAAVGPENICRVAGRDGRMAIHYAAMNGKAEIIDKLLSACPDSVKDVTIYEETVLHLAVKCFKFEALGSLLEWLQKVEMEEVVNWGDMEGNTVLHFAVLKKQVESIQHLLYWNNNNASRNKLQINAVNRKGLTPLDIVDMLIESSNDVHLRDILLRAGASASFGPDVGSNTLTNNNLQSERTNTPANNNCGSERPKKWSDIINYFQFQWQRDSPGEARESLLVVAALIATVTFQAGITPPSYIVEGSRGTNVTATNQSQSVSSNLTEINIQRDIAEAVTTVSIIVFMVANSVALSTATSIIDYLMVGLPFRREVFVSMYAMMFAYGWSLGSTEPTGTVKTVLLTVALSIPLFLRWIPNVVREFGKSRRRNA